MAQAQFVSRSTCINCGSSNLVTLSEGFFDQGALRGFLSADPWGENPAPYLAGQRWSYIKCGACAQSFHARILSPEWSEIKWSRWMSAEAIAEFERLHPTPKFDKAISSTKHVLQLASLLGPKPRVVDFGCGNGEFLKMCLEYGFDAYGVDRSRARRDKAGEVVASIEEIDGQFDAVTLFEVLEHVDDPRGILVMLKERMKPGSILVLETPDCSGVTGIQSQHDYNCIHPLDHINGFTPATLRSIAERLGFRSIKTPVSHVTSSRLKVAKTEARRFPRKATTQQYFTVPVNPTFSRIRTWLGINPAYTKCVNCGDSIPKKDQWYPVCRGCDLPLS